MEKLPRFSHMLIICMGSVSSSCDRDLSLKYTLRKVSENFRFAFSYLFPACSLPCYGVEKPQCHSKMLKNQ